MVQMSFSEDTRLTVALEYCLHTENYHSSLDKKYSSYFKKM